MQYQSGVKADLSIQNTSDITISGGSETNKNADDGFDSWLYDKKRNLVNSFESASISEESDKEELFNDGNSWVGFGDEWDYKEFTLETAAKLQFDLEASDAAKFTIYRLDEKAGKNGVTYTVKTLQSTALKNRDGNTVQTKELLLESGTYYISMQSLNAKKDGNADYNISVSNKSFFYTDADNGFDNWLYDKKTNVVNSFESASISEESDTEELFNDGNSWVGFGDEWDYKEFTLETAAKLQFDLEASDAAKFTIYRLDEKAGKNGVTYTVKTLQSTALKNRDGMYTAQTKELLLESGTYYISMQALNAKKGGYAEYDISFGWDSYLYTEADDGDDNWLYNSKTKEFNDNEGCIIYAGSIEDKVHLTIDDSTLGEAYCWVGFGDEWDHYEFSVDNDMAVSFNISSSDAIKVMIYQIVDGKLKTLQTTSVKADSTVYTKTLNLKEDGEYYIGIQSTNAKKGGNAEYSITGSKYFQPLTMTLKGYNHDQFEDLEEDLWEESGWNREIFIPKYLSFLNKKNLLINDITGTDGHDTISIAANKCCSIAGTIDLKDGNDQFIVSASGGETFLEVFTDGTLIDFGEDNDILKLEKNSFVEIDHYPTSIEFGNGKDLLEFGENAALCGLQTLTLDFGEGNDKLNLLKNSDRIETAEVSMGAGNDAISIDSIGDTVIIHLDFGSGSDVLSVRNKAYISELDFGDGYYNKLVINKNGTLCVDELNGVANVSGTGTLAVSDIDSLEDQMLAELKKSDIDLVAAGYGFTSRKQEAADNSKETAAFIQDDNTTFWLGSEAFKEENGEYGFADTEDWFMAYLNNEDYIMLNLSEGIRCTVYNKREEVIATYADYGHNFEIEKAGLYYFHMEYLGDSHASGRIKIDD